MKKFLTAEWNDLIMANYEVDPMLLEQRVPMGCELDLHDGRCFVSLVGFMFQRTRVLGVPIPFHINFEEINLRFYVTRRCGGEIRHGVIFIKEIVPRMAVTTVARVFYGEPYETMAMRCRREGDRLTYSWVKDGNTNTLGCTIGDDLGLQPEGSHGEFIIDHYWGYTRRGDRRTDEYLVEHPPWGLRSISDPEINVDFSKLYGNDFAFLSERQPYSLLFSPGSEIAVYQGSRII